MLSNAVKYNCDGGLVEVACTPAGAGRIRIEVRDSGRGIDPALLPQLFRPFERLESSYEGIEGSGVGLALSKRLVEAMGGEIGVDSAAGHGSRFWIILPGKWSGAGGGAATSRDTSAPVTEPAQIRSLLYVEDNPANVNLMRRIVALRRGWTLLDAGTAEAGIELARSQRPDIILLDINLPGIDGFEALRRLREDTQTREIPVVAVSASAMPLDVEKGMTAGFADYLTKPLDIVRFLATLDRLLSRPHGAGGAAGSGADA